MLGHAGGEGVMMSVWHTTSKQLPDEDVKVRIYNSLSGFHTATLVSNELMYPCEPPYFVTDNFDTFETHEIEQWRYV